MADTADHSYLGVFETGFASWSRVLSLSNSEEKKLANFRNAAHEAVSYVGKGLDKTVAVEELYELAQSHGLTDGVGSENIEAIIAAAFEPPPAEPKRNGGSGVQAFADFQQANYQEPPPAQEAELILPPRATLYIAPKPETIPPRAWLDRGKHYIRKATTATVAPGGHGKTTLCLYEAITMATMSTEGRRIWYVSGEDPKEEIDRRIAAHCKHHNVDLNNITGGGALFVDDKSSFKFFIGTCPRPAVVKLNEQSLLQFEEAILADRIDVVILDPFVSFHSVPENDNGAIDQVVKTLAGIAQRTNCCIEISHHVRKPFQGQQAMTVDDARGGGAIINAVRSGRVINRMSSVEAAHANIPENDRTTYIRIDKGKRNMAPPEAAIWFQIVGEHIKNNDYVQALKPWDFPKPQRPTAEDVDWLRQTMANGKAYAVDSRTTEWEWIIKPLASHYSRNYNDDKDLKWLKQMLACFVQDKVIRAVERRNKKGNDRQVYILCEENKPSYSTNVQPLFPDPDDNGGD